MITEKDFKKLDLIFKYKMLKNDGVFLASRLSLGFTVSLFAIGKFYVEVWKRISIDNIEWIEVVSSKIVDIYLPNFDINKLTE